MRAHGLPPYNLAHISHLTLSSPVSSFFDLRKQILHFDSDLHTVRQSREMADREVIVAQVQVDHVETAAQEPQPETSHVAVPGPVQSALQ